MKEQQSDDWESNPTLKAMCDRENRHNPKNREMAYAIQFLQDSVPLFQMSSIPDDRDRRVAFKKTLDALKMHIQNYESGV